MSHFNYHQDNLWVENVPLLDVIKNVGTPFYLYSHSALVKNWQNFDVAFGQHPHEICYAVKANSNLAVLNTLAKLGSGFDIVSAGELARVIAAKGNPGQVVFSGVAKQPDEIAFALKTSIACFNIESENELMMLNQIAQHFNVQAPIALRVNPNVDPKSHPYISTGLKESKFGIDIALASEFYLKAKKLPHITIKGVASHIGSQLTSLSPFVEAYSHLLALVKSLQSQGISLSHINIGGGLGIRYHNETPPTPQEYANALLKKPSSLTIRLEPGRAIAADTGILVTKVLSLKKAGNKNFCIVDAAMNDLMRPALYQAWQNIIPLKLSTASKTIYDIVGPVCESGDFLAKERELSVQPDDYLAIMNSGAYGFVMSSNYNSRPRVAEIMVKDKEFKIVRQKETIEQLFSQECLW